VTGTLADLDRYLAAEIRATLEQRYYDRISAQARLEQVMLDPEFVHDAAKHTALWPDHGAVHVRDVACQIKVLEAIHGVLMPARNLERFEFMKAYGVMVAYVHDIGMVDSSRRGRAMHPEFATQAVLSAEFDDIVGRIWQDNCGGIAQYMTNLYNRGAFSHEPKAVLREMLAMANCHSKSKVPVETLNDPEALNRTMLEAASTNLRVLYHQQRVRRARDALALANELSRSDVELDHLSDALYTAEQTLAQAIAAEPQSEKLDPRIEDGLAFDWLLSSHREARALADDVVDTLRALRCADSLRQRGTVLKTSGGYEIFVDQRTSNALCAVRHGDDELFLLELNDSLSVGEANISSSEIGRDGNLRISFHRGAFPDRPTVERAAHAAALVVNDIWGDVVESFRRSSTPRDDHLKTSGEMQILLEGTDDNVEFAELVRQQWQRINPQASGQVRCVPSLQNVSALELARYLEGQELDWDTTARRELLKRVAASGHKTDKMDLVRAFQDVKLIHLAAGQTLIEAGTPASFVYIPLGDGLKVMPLGGYAAFSVRAWMALGNTGVIRGAARNATVIAEQDVTLLMIPKQVFLREWHSPYSLDEFTRLVEKKLATQPDPFEPLLENALARDGAK